MSTSVLDVVKKVRNKTNATVQRTLSTLANHQDTLFSTSLLLRQLQPNEVAKGPSKLK